MMIMGAAVGHVYYGEIFCTVKLIKELLSYGRSWPDWTIAGLPYS
jgi:hypothetical protein